MNTFLLIKPPHSENSTDESSMPKEDGVNKGTLAIDATCAPVNIRYPQDISLLNEAREKLEYMIYRMCKTYGLQFPRCCRRRARKDYLAFAKSRKHTKKQIQSAIRKQLSYVRRDIGYLEGYFSQGCVPDTKDIPFILTIFKLYEQQEYMYKNKVHSVPDRIVSISQPWIRPIVRGKVKAPVEFGAKLDVSIDEEGYGRLEKVSFDAYNESGCLIEAVERYKSRTGHYPERVLADRSIGPGITVITVKSTGYGCQGQSLADHHRMPKQIRNGNIRITRTGLKWNDFSAEVSAAMAWDLS